MKKYLMTGIAAVTLCAAFTSCSHDSDGFSTLQEAKDAEYAVAFEKAYGKISSTQDWGFGSATRTRQGSAPNANEWGNIGVPPIVTDQERSDAYDWFSTHKDWPSESVDLKDFFVQQVWKGGDVYTAKDGLNHAKGSDKMNWLWCGSVPFVEGATPDENTMDHVFNFNAGTGSYNGSVWDGTLTNPADPNSKVYHADSIQLVLDSSSKYWAFHSSEDSQLHPLYKIKKIGEYYYIGFDFCATGANPNQQYEPDGYYSDWIVRIKGVSEPVVEKGRIFCEDLGSIGDFDFNDVVFDAYIYKSGKIHIDVLAAGGTLPMKVANHDIVAGMKNSVQKKMVNTGLDTAPIYSFDIPAKSEGVPEYASLKDIPVVVTQKVNQYDQEIMLKSEIGAAPQKICLPVGTKWVDEYVDINAAYPNFEYWVRQSEGIISPVQAVGTRVDKYVDLNLSNNAPYRTK